VFVQVIDPEAFGGRAALERQTDHLRTISHASRTRPGVTNVRLPGEGGLARKRAHLAEGVALHASIMPALAEWATKLSVNIPPTI
jgi:L-lactate dehydrogenase